MQKNNSRISFLISSFLLQYPNAEWVETLEEVIKETEAIKHEAFCKPLLKFFNYAKAVKELDLAELYVRTFDFTKNNNLYLTYYEYKEDRKRGEALLNIKDRYREAGVNFDSDELPDFLPTVLEFTAISGADDLIVKHKNIIKNLFESLSKSNNPYSLIFEAVLLLLNEPVLFEHERVEELGGVVE
jgi:nitrate reductase molybdenum cofactor assembly chaperone NarJ/NarW